MELGSGNPLIDRIFEPMDEEVSIERVVTETNTIKRTKLEEIMN